MDSERLEDCMLCGAASKEFALESHNICPNTNNHFCPCGELEQLDGQIRNFLHSALKKRQELRLRVNHFHNQKFRQTPPEVISNIFFFYVSSVQLEQPVGPPRWCPASKHKLSGPLILGAVCRKWREIAWSTPRLWSSIIISLSPKSFSKLAVVREWLRRSGQLPLSIPLVMRSRYIYNIADNLLPMVHLLNKYAGRWHHLGFHAIPHNLLSAFKVNLNGQGLQGASTLHIANVLREPAEGWVGTPPIVQGLSPTVVKLSRVPFPSIGISWSRVTRVQALGFSVDECIELFHRAPLLTDCMFLDVGSDQQEYPLPNDIIIHTSLNTLRLQLGDSIINTFLFHLSFPSLLELHLQSNGLDDAPLTDKLLSFFERSPLLKTLKLLGPIIEHDNELVHVLSTTPALTHLYIYLYDSTPLTLHYLFTRLAESWLVEDDPCRASEQFLPKLQCLHFSGYSSNPWDDLSKAFGPISEITNPRRRPFNQLQFESLDYDADRDNEHSTNMMRLVPLKEAGINLKIMDPDYDNKDLLEEYLCSSPQNTP